MTEIAKDWITLQLWQQTDMERWKSTSRTRWNARGSRRKLRKQLLHDSRAAWGTDERTYLPTDAA